jgi:hypothetical protein
VNSEWRKSSFSNGNGGNNCVEVRKVRGDTWDLIGFEVRDSKDKDGPVLRFTQAEWDAFIAGVKAGEFE